MIKQTDAQPTKKVGLWKTAKKIVENYPGVSINVVKHQDKEETGYIDVHWINIAIGEEMLEELESIMCTIDKLPDNLSFGDNMGVFAKENVVRTSAKGAQMRWLSKEFKQAIIENKEGLELMLLIGFVPWQV